MPPKPKPDSPSDLRPGTIRVVVSLGDEIEELEGTKALDGLLERCRKPGAAVWIDLTDPSPERASKVGTALALHPLIIEHVLEGNQRAKIETADGVIHLVLFRLDYDEQVATSELDIVMGPGFLLTVHEANWDPRGSDRLRSGLASTLQRGTDHLLWALADEIVDGYFPFADRIGDAIDDVQDQVIRKASPEVLEELFRLKRELLAVRRAVSPVREVFNQLTNRDIALIDEEELVYYRDIYDHIIRLTDELDNYRELASATLDVYLSTINNNLSIIMKRLTGVTVILAGIGAIAGVFGMSEAGTALGGAEAGGFWFVTAITVGLAATAAIVLRRIDWI
jgi:magnesium transporter